MEKPMTHTIREQIALYRKNKIDISSLITDVCIKNEDLSYCIISSLTKNETDISGCNFSHAILGSDKTIISIIRTNLSNCNFEGANFIGKSWIRSCNARNCNFKNANVALIDYQHTDFRGSSFCGSIIRIDTNSGIGCIFPKEMFEDLCKGWKMKINVEEVS
jgi:uncharacterized protein YjbI with pentapeptide repeats